MSKGPKFHAILNLDSGQNKNIVHSISHGTFYCRLNSHYIYLGTTGDQQVCRETCVYLPLILQHSFRKWQTQHHIKAKANKAISIYIKKISFTFPTSCLLPFVSTTLRFPLTNFELSVPQQTLKMTEWPLLLHRYQLYFFFAHKCYPTPSTSEAPVRSQAWQEEERTGVDFHCVRSKACG